MAIFGSSVLTKKGNELLVNAVAGNRIVFTRMVAGSGIYTDRERDRNSLEKMTALKNKQMETTFSKYEKSSEQSILLTGVFTNKKLSHSCKITEVGIYGKKADEEEDFLCSIAVTESLEGSDTFPPYNGLLECQIVQDYYITLSPDAEVTVVTKGACVLMEDFEQFRQTIITKEKELETKKLDKTGDGGDLTISFAQADNRQNITDGMKLKTIMGIIARVFSDLTAAAFAAIVNDLVTTREGTVLDGRQGKALKDMIEEAKTEIKAVRQAFLDGCNTIVAGCTTYGATPAGNSPAQIVDAIKQIWETRYGAGVDAGKAQAAIITRTIEINGSWQECTGTLPQVEGYRLVHGYVQCKQVYTDYEGGNWISFWGSVDLDTGKASVYVDGKSLGDLKAVAVGIYMPA